MPVRTHLQILFATLLFIGSFSLAETVEPWKTGNIDLGGLLYPVIQVDERDVNGFIACYSHDVEMSSYYQSGIYLKGFIALQGQYIGRIFHPEGYLDKDISPVYTTPSTMCQEYLPSCQNGNVEPKFSS